MALQHPNMTVAHRQLTAKERQILEKQVLVHVGIVLPDGTPHVSAITPTVISACAASWSRSLAKSAAPAWGSTAC